MAELLHVSGLADLKARFAAIPREVGKKILRFGVSVGAKIVKAEVKVRVPISTKPRKRGKYMVNPGTLRRALITRYVREQSNETQSTFYVLFRQGQKQQAGGRDAYYAKWVERGHRNVARFKGKYTDYKIRGRGRLTGLNVRRRASTTRTPPHPFLAPGFDASKGRAATAMVDTMTGIFNTQYGRP